jgi:hypothetical protein
MLMLQRRATKKTNESYAIGHIDKHQRTPQSSLVSKILELFHTNSLVHVGHVLVTFPPPQNTWHGLVASMSIT